MKQGEGDLHAELYFTKPEEETKWVQFRRMAYDSKTGRIFGRTPFLWGRVLLFYTVFYCVLAGLFATMMKALLYTLDENKPKYLLRESRIGTSPGLGYRPLGTKYLPDSSLIRFVARSKNNTMSWVEDLDRFLDDYKNPKKRPGKGKNLQKCSYDEPPRPGNVCSVEMTDWEPCTHEMGYGYNASSPCIFLKLNKIYGWVPEYYDAENLPEKMPESLKNEIRNSTAKNPETLNTVWLSCEGEGPADRENIGPVTYFPRQGFPGYYYPYTNLPGYLSPLVAVKFQRPTPNVLINVECRAWARNIVYQHKNQLGSCHLEIMVDHKKVFHY